MGTLVMNINGHLWWISAFCEGTLGKSEYGIKVSRHYAICTVKVDKSAKVG